MFLNNEYILDFFFKYYMKFHFFDVFEVKNEDYPLLDQIRE
jgi:hypothetical protein